MYRLLRFFLKNEYIVYSLIVVIEIHQAEMVVTILMSFCNTCLVVISILLLVVLQVLR